MIEADFSQNMRQRQIKGPNWWMGWTFVRVKYALYKSEQRDSRFDEYDQDAISIPFQIPRMVSLMRGKVQFSRKKPMN